MSWTAAEPASRAVIFESAPWVRHTIDDTSRGADGVKLGDLNGDGLLDVATGWEEGGLVRVYLNPGPGRSTRRWPSVTVGSAPNAEDAIFVDLDGDGRLEVVSATEGGTNTLFRHRFIGKSTDELLDPSRWQSDPFPSLGKQWWMQAAFADLDGRNQLDLVVASKNQGATIGWLEGPSSPNDLAAWRYHPLRTAGWIMTLVPYDFDADGDRDILFTDRVGPRSGVAWLENPGAEANQRGDGWPEHPVGAAGRTVMFADLGDLNGDGMVDIVAAIKPVEVAVWIQKAGNSWDESVIRLAANNLGDAKAVKIADLDNDGLMDLVFTCESAKGQREGVVWLRQQVNGPWQQRSIGGPEGVKYDLIQALDLDSDGDLDILTTEEVDQLGVVWYENPQRRPHNGESR